MKNFEQKLAKLAGSPPSIYERKLVQLLQMAHAGERAAASAYWGHYNSLFVTSKKEKQEIRDIYLSELHHRERLGDILSELGYAPTVLRECMMHTIGFVIGFLCLFGGWFIPMYGAARLESNNMLEYEAAALLAFLSGHEKFCSELLEFGEVEWDHELYFREKSNSHWASRFFPKLTEPAPRETIRTQFDIFKNKSLASS